MSVGDDWPFPEAPPPRVPDETGRRRPVVPHHPPPSLTDYPAGYPTAPVPVCRPVRPMVTPDARVARRWRLVAVWGVPTALILGMLVGAILTGAAAGSERPHGRLQFCEVNR